MYANRAGQQQNQREQCVRNVRGPDQGFSRGLLENLVLFFHYESRFLVHKPQF